MAQLELLAALAEHPGARPGQLARLLNMRPNTVATVLAVSSVMTCILGVTAGNAR